MKRKKIRSAWKEYFNFSTRERRGAFFLFCILTIQLIFLFWIHSHPISIDPPDPLIVKQLIEENQRDNSPEVTIKNFPVSTQNRSATTSILTPFDFNPNTINESGYKRLGLSDKQIKVLANYKNHGGSFRTKNDFKKMYCISLSEYDILRHHLLLPDTLERKTNSFSFARKINSSKTIDIGNADSTSLLKVKGIGPTLAGRIIKYREKLGGFINISQLKEVWGIQDSAYENIQSQLILKDSIPFHTINLNTDSFITFSSHPYIKYKLASQICNYRKQHGSIEAIGELRQLPLITEENFLKLAPYLSLK